MFPVSGFVVVPPPSGGSGGGTPPPTPGGLTEAQVRTIVEGYGYLTTATGGGGGPDASTIQSWIRGSGLFRRIALVIGPMTMTDEFWQSFILMSVLPGDHTLNVVQPSNTLGVNMVPFTAPADEFIQEEQSDTPPRGVWTVIMNTAQGGGSATVRFGEDFTTVYGIDQSGASGPWTTVKTVTLAPGRMLFIAYVGDRRYYINYL